MNEKKQDVLQIILFYIVMGWTGYYTYHFIEVESEILRFLGAHVAMTIICFIFSLFKKNSSVYDAFWSVIPFYFCIQWLLLHPSELNYFHYIIFGTISLWSWRLTLNWVRSWDGFGHEDWRYVDLANKSGKMYPFVNFLGIHLFPTLMVFAGMLPIFYTIGKSNPNLIVFVLGVLVSLLGIYFEFSADNVLYKFRNDPSTKREDVLDKGLWGQCRYPNYLGEILFWSGLAIIGFSFGAPWFTAAGSIAMALMILFVSIPMKEERMSARRPKFKAYQEKVPLIIPFIGKKN